MALTQSMKSNCTRSRAESDSRSASNEGAAAGAPIHPTYGQRQPRSVRRCRRTEAQGFDCRLERRSIRVAEVLSKTYRRFSRWAQDGIVNAAGLPFIGRTPREVRSQEEGDWVRPDHGIDRAGVDDQPPRRARVGQDDTRRPMPRRHGPGCHRGIGLLRGRLVGR
jgi:hypothetical protein